jgi:hypothetical protein
MLAIYRPFIGCAVSVVLDCLSISRPDVLPLLVLLLLLILLLPRSLGKCGQHITIRCRTLGALGSRWVVPAVIGTVL